MHDVLRDGDPKPPGVPGRLEALRNPWGGDRPGRLPERRRTQRDGARLRPGEHLTDLPEPSEISPLLVQRQKALRHVGNRDVLRPLVGGVQILGRLLEQPVRRAAVDGHTGQHPADGGELLEDVRLPRKRRRKEGRLHEARLRVRVGPG